ncbi:MAG: hypothetical protein KGY66_05260 [Candidatus Thermoplasmatota archaeon]|nr:hypothetical protein [Candidatus Thermoplasmatota archaeon]MBS3790307.1 hypothetical protein [Candidatus Thermoplasmatota archaeon]
MADKKNKKKYKEVSSYLPKKIKQEVFKRRRSTPFLISVSFLAAFIAARLWVIYFEAAGTVTPEVTYTVGRNLVMGGYHIHHITYGIVLVSLSAWLAINYWSKNIARISSIMYGLGLGLIVDELGFIIGGIRPYQGDTEVFYVAIGVIATLASIVYFPAFYRAIRRDLKKFQGESDN